MSAERPTLQFDRFTVPGVPGTSPEWRQAALEGRLVRMDLLRKGERAMPMLASTGPVVFQRVDHTGCVHVVSERTGEAQIYAGCAGALPL